MADNTYIADEIRQFNNNILPRNSRRTRKGKAGVMDGSRSMRVLVVGSSMARGRGASFNNSVQDVQRKSYPTRLAERLSALGLRASWQSFFGDAAQNGAINVWDPRVVPGSGWSFDGARQTLGGMILNSGTTNPLVFTPTQDVNMFDIYTMYAGGNTTLAVSIGGNDPTVGPNILYTNGNLAVNKATSGVASASKAPLALTPGAANANTRVVGVIGYNTVNPSIDVINAAIPGSGVAEWVANTGVWSPFNLINSINADLVIIDVMTITRNNNVSVATALSDLKKLTDQIKLIGSDIMLVIPPPSNPDNTISIEAQQAYVAPMKKFAIDNNCMYDNWYERNGTFIDMTNDGIVFDAVHGNMYMAADYGQHLANLIVSV